MHENFKIKGFIFGFSALVWVGSYLLDSHFLQFPLHTPGIDIVFIPSGVRLMVIMIGGIWAALGVCVGSLFLVAVRVKLVVASSSRGLPIFVS